MSNSFVDFAYSESEVNYIQIPDMPEKKCIIPSVEKKSEIKDVVVAIKPSSQYKLTLSGLLRQKKQELRKGISLLEKGIRNRKYLIYGLMFSVMAGTAAYMFYKYFKYPEFKAQADQEYFDLLKQLQSQLGDLLKKLDILNLNKEKLLRDFQPILDAWNNAQANFASGISKWECHPPSGNQYNFTQSCNDLMPYWGCPNADEYPWADGCYHQGTYIKVTDPCPDLNTDMCNTYDPWYWGDINLRVTSKLISDQTALVSQMQDRIANLLPNYDVFFDGCGGAVGFYLILFLFGELSPAAVILLTLLTHVVDSVTDVISCVRISKNDSSEVKQIAAENLVTCETSYVETLTELREAERSIERESKALKPMRDLRQAFMMGTKGGDNNILFTSEMKSPHDLPIEIFKMADMDDNLARASMLSFASGFDPRFRRYNRNYYNPIFSFFAELKEQGKEKSKEALTHIYEFAGYLHDA